MRVNCLLDLHELSKPNFWQKKNKNKNKNKMSSAEYVTQHAKQTDNVRVSYQITMSTWQLLPWLKRHIYCCIINSTGIILKIVMLSMLWTDLAADNKFMISFLLLPQNKIYHFMKIHPLPTHPPFQRDNLHEMSNLIF